jgi:Collagen triple helix repeat (20 copies)
MNRTLGVVLLLVCGCLKTPSEYGVDGAAGARGDVGPKGERGEMGPAGPAGPAGRDGAAGATGPQGPAGVPGPPGIASGVSLDRMQVRRVDRNTSVQFELVYAECKKGEAMLSGGCNCYGNGQLIASEPNSTVGWSCSCKFDEKAFVSPPSVGTRVTASVVCLQP